MVAVIVATEKERTAEKIADELKPHSNVLVDVRALLYYMNRTGVIYCVKVTEFVGLL